MKNELWHRSITQQDRNQTKDAKELFNSVVSYLKKLESSNNKVAPSIKIKRINLNSIGSKTRK